MNNGQSAVDLIITSAVVFEITPSNLDRTSFSAPL